MTPIILCLLLSTTDTMLKWTRVGWGSFVSVYMKALGDSHYGVLFFFFFLTDLLLQNDLNTQKESFIHFLVQEGSCFLILKSLFFLFSEFLIHHYEFLI